LSGRAAGHDAGQLGDGGKKAGLTFHADLERMKVVHRQAHSTSNEGDSAGRKASGMRSGLLK